MREDEQTHTHTKKIYCTQKATRLLVDIVLIRCLYKLKYNTQLT